MLDSVERIFVPAPNKLVFMLKNASQIECEWQDRSRKDSWNHEMKRRAAENGRKRCRI